MSSSTTPPRCLTPDERLKALMQVASSVQFMPGMDIQQYFRAMRSMVAVLDMYIQTNQKETAYVLASRFAIVCLEHLPKHRSYSSIDTAQKNEWNRRCRNVLSKAESLKQELRSRYESEYQKYLQAEEARQEEARKLEIAENERQQQEKRASVLGNLVPKSPTPNFTIMPLQDERVQNHKIDSIIPMPPPIDRSSKPLLNISNRWEWAPVRISPSLAHQFLRLAEANTKRNMETCGNLCGRRVGSEFHITDLVLPKQSGTSDSCTTYKEEELFDYTEKHGLLVLGWIHTHPSQTAFLSSVDQHSQLSYQIMLPEAIAIVCAPKFNEIQTFSLTPDNGIQFVLECKEVGFHPHNLPSPIYEPSKHVIDDPNLLFNVIDLR